MEKSQHTPGPWELHTPNVICGVHTIRAGASHVIAKLHTRRGEEPNEANASLLAAAPELLEVLIKVLNAEPDCLFSDEIRAAIAKATGASKTEQAA